MKRIFIFICLIIAMTFMVNVVKSDIKINDFKFISFTSQENFNMQSDICQSGEVLFVRAGISGTNTIINSGTFADENFKDLKTNMSNQKFIIMERQKFMVNACQVKGLTPSKEAAFMRFSNPAGTNEFV